MRAEILEAIGNLSASRLQGRRPLTKLGGCSSEGARRTVLHSSSMESTSDDGKPSSHSSLCSTPAALACSGNTGILV